MRNFYYILDENKKPKSVPNVLQWARWFDKADRHVGITEIGPLRISTVFLGINHNFGMSDDTRPVLFETMIFGFDEDDSYQTRCATWEEAEHMHKVAARLAEVLVAETNMTLANFIAKLNAIEC